jgi:hypothetical protein
MRIYLAVKMPFTAPLHRLAVPFIFSNIGNQAMIPEELPGSTGIKATICIEKVHHRTEKMFAWSGIGIKEHGKGNGNGTVLIQTPRQQAEAKLKQA